MKIVRDSNDVIIKPFDVVRNTNTNEMAIVEIFDCKGYEGLGAYNEVTGLDIWLESYPDGQWEVVGSMLTYWCTESFTSKEMQVEYGEATNDERD